MIETMPVAMPTNTGPQSRPGAIPYGKGGPTFGGILASLTGATATRPAAGGATGTPSRHAARKFNPHATGTQSRHAPRSSGSLPGSSQTALQQAMSLENVPASWQSGLQFIMAQESGGTVDVRNPRHSARGLYQLTAANYHFNPRGADSFGNGVEEAQGGIRYIKNRYGTAENAVAFWQQHHWY